VPQLAVDLGVTTVDRSAEEKRSEPAAVVVLVALTFRD
jgi:hypothetical protein